MGDIGWGVKGGMMDIRIRIRIYGGQEVWGKEYKENHQKWHEPQCFYTRGNLEDSRLERAPKGGYQKDPRWGSD